MTLIAVAHLKTRIGAKRTNMEHVKNLVKEAREKGAKLVVLPSMFNSGPIIDYLPPQRLKYSLKSQAERIPGPSTEQLTTIAIGTSLYIVAGPIIERAGPKLFLTTIIVGPDGGILGKYRKIALSPKEEQIGISSGRELVYFNLDRKYGILAEEDIITPEIARSLKITGADSLITSIRVKPSNKFTNYLLIARAIENNLPVIAAGGIVENQGEIAGEVASMIYDPREGVIGFAEGAEEQVIVADLPKAADNGLLVTANSLKLAVTSLCKIARNRDII